MSGEPEPVSDGPGSGDAQTQFIESVLSLLFLQKFDAYHQTQTALKNHLRQPAGRAALATVLTARQAQWSPITSRAVADCLVGAVSAAFEALESGAAMDRVTGTRTFSSEAAVALALVEIGQAYTLPGEAGRGDGQPSSCLLARLGGLRLWSEMRFWHGVLEVALEADGVSKAVAAVRDFMRSRGEEEHTSTVVEALGMAQYEAGTWLSELHEMQNHGELTHFVEVCQARRSHLPDYHAAEVEVVRLLSNCAYVMLAQLGLPLQAVSAFAAGVCVERNVSKAAKVNALAAIDELGRELKETQSRMIRNPVSERGSPEVAARGRMLSGYLYKQCGHAVGQDVTRPTSINVVDSRIWKKFWFVLNPNELMCFLRPKDRQPILRIRLHEQTLTDIDERNGCFSIRSLWRSFQLRVPDEASEQESVAVASIAKTTRILTRVGSAGLLGSPPASAAPLTNPLRKWTQALSVAIEQSTAAMTGGTSLTARSRGLRIAPVDKTPEDIRAITSFAENLWHKHDAMRMMEETNKEINEQIKEDMREFVETCSMTGQSATLGEWAKVSVWAADTGGARDSSNSPIRAQRGVWKKLFEQVLSEGGNAGVLRQLEIDYAGNIAGGESRMVRSLCYDMGHVFEDEEELASCIADMRAIGEGTVTEYAFVKWWYKNAGNIVLPSDYSADVLDAIRHFKFFDESACGALTPLQLLELGRDLNWPDTESWRTVRVLGDSDGVVSLRSFLLLYNDRQLARELIRVYDVDQNGKLNLAELSTLCAEWIGANSQAASLLLAHFDSNGDGEINLEEIVQLIRAGRTSAKPKADILASTKPFVAQGQVATDLEATVSAWVAQICRPAVEKRPAALAFFPAPVRPSDGSRSGPGNKGIGRETDVEDEEVRTAMKAAMIASTVSKSADKMTLGRARAQTQSIDAHRVVSHEENTSPSITARRGPGYGLGSDFQIDDNDEEVRLAMTAAMIASQSKHGNLPATRAASQSARTSMSGHNSQLPEL